MTKGITLVETLVTIAIFALMMGVVIGFIFMAYRSQDFTLKQSWAVSQARKGITTMVREIREARPGDDGAYIIELAQDYEFVFYSDIDKDEAIERVRYFIEGTDFKKGVIEPVGWPIEYPSETEEIFVLSQHVRNLPPIFHYYDGDGQEITDLPARPKDTKMMGVYLVINENPARAPQDFELESHVQIRNLKTNL